MREIKFRGLRTDGKGWVYGDLNQYDVHNGVSISENSCIINAVIPESVGQFTGLKDKNGKEIYEGDIVRVNTYVNVQYEVFEPDELVAQEIITEVSYNELFGAFELVTIEEDLHLKSWGFYDEDENNDLEVIGNIHENPELCQ